MMQSMQTAFHTVTHLIGESPALLASTSRIPIAAQCDVTVLLQGETGTGKELFARAIHYQSERHGKPFIPVNCGALPDHLFENEFFGHAKGAYTDASSVAKGLVAEAEGGTLFLDEVDTLSHAAQIKLLRFLQDREYRPLGASSSIVANVRVIAATNADLASKVESQSFRQDLYYRLKAFPIVIPPLRERMEDIPLLVDHFVQLFTQQHKLSPKPVAESALQKLMCYRWPGNVRELECTILQAVMLSRSAKIEAVDITLPDDTAAPAANATPTLQDLERDYILNILSNHKGNVTHAARAAGKHRRSFQRLLRKHGIDRAGFAV